MEDLRKIFNYDEQSVLIGALYDEACLLKKLIEGIMKQPDFDEETYVKASYDYNIAINLLHRLLPNVSENDIEKRIVSMVKGNG